MERVKGVTLSFTEYIAERYGKGELAAFASVLRPDAARVILEGPVKSTWYSRDLYFNILIEFARRYARGNPAHLMRDIAAFSAERDPNSIYRFFLKFGYPGYVLGKAAVLWQNYYDGGKMEIVLAVEVRRHPQQVALRQTRDQPPAGNASNPHQVGLQNRKGARVYDAPERLNAEFALSCGEGYLGGCR